MLLVVLFFSLLLVIKLWSLIPSMPQPHRLPFRVLCAVDVLWMVAVGAGIGLRLSVIFTAVALLSMVPQLVTWSIVVGYAYVGSFRKKLYAGELPSLVKFFLLPAAAVGLLSFSEISRVLGGVVLLLELASAGLAFWLAVWAEARYHKACLDM